MSVVNYPGPEVSWTRIIEYKHFPWVHEQNNHTLIVKEYSTEKGEPYYPVLTDGNLELYQRDQSLAAMERRTYFLGRLATVKYITMDQAIANALEFIDNNCPAILSGCSTKVVS
jgi:UDP-galactopyranose mutase